jgi:uncharacterized protein YbgA (DUF1722 family)/uncharacterized protein YbbK (DUF523 family)
MEKCITLGVSACLLGENVRYDGTSKLDPYLVHTLARFARFVPVCPETGSGMEVPREPVDLWGAAGEVRAVGRESRTDYSESWREWARENVKKLEEEDLWGMILKSRSPSCGPKTDIREGCGQKRRPGMGLFAEEVARSLPLVPVESEESLYDPGRRGNFIVRIFAMRRLKKLVEGEQTRGRLVDFHTREKLLLMAHSVEGYQSLGRVVARPTKEPIAKVYETYRDGFIAALSHRSTRAKNCNVLMHAAGYFKRNLDVIEKGELGESIESYRAGLLPLTVPLTLINHWNRRWRHPWLGSQSYLNPHPLELRLKCMV